MERYICIHGHFYQPPRENPWLETVEYQESAHPYHDWNERINAECYAPNARSRILDEDGRILRLVNNYADISFNFGPTLLAWMEKKSPSIHKAIVDADRESKEKYAGHGNALAQAYNHMIMPLANARDKRTQVIWGIADFRYRFGRDPEGMWLPETAVDLESLDIMAEMGILLTILAPRQAHRVRDLNGGDWRDVSGGRVDPTQAYLVALPSGRSMAVFFYDGPLSQAIAFEGLLQNGELFATRLLDGFDSSRSRPEVVHVATDGESYGHHHRKGDMALAYALEFIRSRGLGRLVNYGEYLELHPPAQEVEIFQNSSWSCIHGIERWRSDCGCNSGGYPQWNQAWRGALREALDWLRDTLEPAFEETGSRYFRDPWKARDEYIRLVLDRSPDNVKQFFSELSPGDLSLQDRINALKLLEVQRNAMRMYTSCGWFFDEVSGIETVQIIQYAGRAIQLTRELFGDAVEPRFVQLLQNAVSNIPEHGNGRRIYEKWVRPSVVDLPRVAAHFGVASIFEDNPEHTVGAYEVEQEDFLKFETGRNKMVIGRASFTSRITTESSLLTYGVLHLGDHNIRCGVRTYQGSEPFETLVKEISGAFHVSDIPETILLLDKHFGASTYSLMSLFRDEQLKVLALILEPALQEAEMVYGQLYEHHAPLVRFLVSGDAPVATPLYWATEFVMNSRLKRAVSAEELDERNLRALLEEAEFAGIRLDSETLEYAFRTTLEKLAQELGDSPEKGAILEKMARVAEVLPLMPFEVNLRRVQDKFWAFLQSSGRELATSGIAQTKSSAETESLLKHLAFRLGIKYSGNP